MVIKQKVHDALLKELLKKDDKGRYSNLIELIKDEKFTVNCSVFMRNDRGCIDVVLTYPNPPYCGVTEDGGLLAADGPHKPTAFELVTDADFDFGKKLEQVKKYKQEYKDVRVIIPEEYKEDYAQLFAIENVTVHTWKGTRIWKCDKCGNIMEVKDSSMQPVRCSSNSCKNTQTFYVIGLKDVQFK